MESLAILIGCALMMLVVIATAAVFARFNSFYRRELAETGSRELALDGLRGLAALMVAAHHAALCRTWIITGEWSNAGSRLPQLFGPAGVILFFMLTGYLFWGKARAAKGWMNPLKLWRGRLYRIAPLYLFGLLLLLLVATVETGTHWLSPAHWKPMVRLLGLGTVIWSPLGNVNPLDYNAGVTWTLWFEWRFYWILPLIAWLPLGRKIFGVTLAIYVFIAAGIWFDLSVSLGLYFIFGMLASEILLYPSVRARLRRSSTAAVALLVCAALGFSLRHLLPAVGVGDTLALVCFPLFITAAAGNTFFGFLIHPALRCLGAISFSLYLLHGIVFKFVGYALKTASLNHLSLPAYWLLFFAVAIATTCLCAATYRWIEFPFLSVSHKSRSEGKPQG